MRVECSRWRRRGLQTILGNCLFQKGRGMSSQIASHVWLPEPKLAFHPDRASDRDIHPLRGLLRFGPHSSGLMPDPIRVATLTPAGESHRLYAFMKELNSVWRATERVDYLP